MPRCNSRLSDSHGRCWRFRRHLSFHPDNFFMKRIQVCLAGAGLLAIGSVLTVRPSAVRAEISAPRVGETKPLSRLAPLSGGNPVVRRDSTRHVETVVERAPAGISTALTPSKSQPILTAFPSRPARTFPAPIKRQSIRIASRHSSKKSQRIIHDNPLRSTPVAQTGTRTTSPQDALEIRSDTPPARSPAALIEIDDPTVSQPDARERLGEIASNFTNTLTRSGLDPADPGYLHLWERERAVADARFRSMYGGQVWMTHHIQSHHAQFRPPPQ